MHVLMIHCAYLTRGGEDVSLEVDTQLLRDHGHQVTVPKWSNVGLGSLQALSRQVWSQAVYHDVRERIEIARPDVVHVHNTAWALGPTAVCAAHDAGMPVAASLPNERLRSGPRELRNPYAGTRGQAAALLIGNALHRRRTWIRKVDCFIAVSRYIKGQMADVGFPPERIVVKPDTVYPVPSFAPPEHATRFLLVGRLTREKGLGMLLAAWRGLPDLQLDIVGRCPTQPQPQVGVTYHGTRSHEEVLQMMAAARAVVVPSIWPEPSGRVAFEAMACGTPVIASNVGGLPEARPAIVCTAGSSRHLAAAIREAAGWSPDELVRRRLIARAEFERHLTPDHQLKRLLGAYEQALEHRARRAKSNWRRLRDPAVDAQLACYDAELKQ